MELAYGVPDNLTDVTWWNQDDRGIPAPKPGGPPGNANIALFFGHTGINGDVGVFDKLYTLQVGQRVTLIGYDALGRTIKMVLEVVRVVPQLDKSNPNALNDSIDAAPAATRVSFITCFGKVNQAIASSDANSEVDTAIISAEAVGK